MTDSGLPPGPRTPAFLQTWAWVRRPVALLEDCARRFGKRFTLRFVGGRDYVVLSDPADVKEVFTAPPDALLAGRANRNFATFLGPHSLFVLDGERHRKHRRLIVPPLRGERLGSLGALMRDATVADLPRWTAGRAFPSIERFRDITLEIILRAIFGVRDEARLAELRSLLHELTESGSAKLAFLPALQTDLGPWSPWGAFLRRRKRFFALLQSEIEDARRNPGTRDDILARLVAEGDRSGEPLADDEITAECMTLLGAGHETTTAALAWTLYFLLATPAARSRVVEEVRAATPGPDFDPAAIDKLPYLGAVIDESLRRRPLIPIVPRWAAREFVVRDLRLPAGTYVAPCSYLVQHDPDVFPEPEAFRPERFLRERPRPYEFFPFGGGGRICVGGAFANYEMKLILAVVLGGLELQLESCKLPAIGRHGITLTPAGGTPVLVKGRRW
ncbi:MAG: cytochrome P450 [Planctomycetes bacterium]|nr:cytochrome P450 [Planctomycetota bacterium]